MSGPNPSGLCMCGCGQPTAIAKTDQERFGQVKGHPVRYLVGHCNRKSPVEYVEEDRGYETPCWVWQRAVGKLGYGNTWTGGTTRNAHRVYYERAYGPIPAGMQLDHLCRVRACVNPAHLEPVSNRENSHRGLKLRLSWDDVQVIRASNKTHREIAAEFGVGEAYVWKVRNRKRRVAA